MAQIQSAGASRWVVFRPGRQGGATNHATKFQAFRAEIEQDPQGLFCDREVICKLGDVRRTQMSLGLQFYHNVMKANEVGTKRSDLFAQVVYCKGLLAFEWHFGLFKSQGESVLVD